MNTTLKPPPKTVRMVTMQAHVEFARIAANTRLAQNRFFRTKSSQHLEEARDWERRLDEATTAVIQDWNTPLTMFQGENAPPRPLPAAADVVRFLEAFAEQHVVREPDTIPTDQAEEIDRELEAKMIREVIEILDQEDESV